MGGRAGETGVVVEGDAAVDERALILVGVVVEGGPADQCALQHVRVGAHRVKRAHVARHLHKTTSLPARSPLAFTLGCWLMRISLSKLPSANHSAENEHGNGPRRVGRAHVCTAPTCRVSGLPMVSLWDESGGRLGEHILHALSASSERGVGT